MKKPGRNDPCPCGSDRKFKHCCGQLNSAARAESVDGAPAVEQSLRVAVEHHQAGRLQQAETIYRQILQATPDQPDALHLLGMVASETGQDELAAELIGKAIGINPIAPMYYNLGNVLRNQNKLDEAIANYRKALSLKPDYANACLNLGAALKARGKLEEAADSFRRLMRLEPGFVDTHLHLGNTLQAQGRLDEAMASFREALKLKPDYVEAHINLGNALKEQGRLDEAVECFRKALSLRPDYAEAYNNLGNALLERDGLDEAIECFRKALSLRPDYAEAYNNLGNALKEQGKTNEAAACYGQALALDPGRAETHDNLGNALKDLGRLDEAIACYRKATVLKPDFADAYLSLGDALREQGDPDEAAAHFHKAIALKPDCAGAYIGLSSLCQDSGQFAAAGSYLEQALALSPDHPVACAAQPYLRKMTEEDAAWLEKACGIIKEGLKPQDEMKLAYALGKYHDDTRQYEAAFGYYERANRLKKLSSPPFDRKDFSRLIDAIISIHDMEVMRRRHAGSSTSARPLLIVGMPRSGTSLTEQILASHPDVAGAGELRFWGQQAQAQHSVMRSWHRDAHLLQSLAARYEAELLRHSPDALRVVDKMPGNFLYLGLIHAVFPEARFLHTQRNPIDTCLSIYFQDFPRQHHYANDLDDLAFYYREYHRLMAHWRRVLPPEVFLDVPYEALVEDQEGWSRRIAGFAGLEWSERCLRFHETERRVGTASNWQVRQKIYRTSRERWRSYERFAGPLLPLLELDRH